MSERIEILLAEDNPGDVRLIQEAFSECETNCQIHVTRDGGEATDFLYQRGAYRSATRPDLTLLDLNLPNKDGGELLAEMQTTPTCNRFP